MAKGGAVAVGDLDRQRNQLVFAGLDAVEDQAFDDSDVVAGVSGDIGA